MVGLGAAVIVVTRPGLPDDEGQRLAFVALTAAAAIAQLFPVVSAKHQGYYLTPIFIFAGLLLLPERALPLMIVLAFVPAWVRTGYPWHMQVFNIANLVVDTFVARLVFVRLGGGTPGAIGEPVVLIAALLAVVLFALLNHLSLAIVLRLARGRPFRETRLLDLENLLIDATLCCTGIITALLWVITPWLAALAAAPPFLIYRALYASKLQEEARTDDKTGLYNSRHFYQVLEEEFERAMRFRRPLTVIMSDLDLLRNINNAYGHLAGDAVLRGVAHIIKEGLRKQDLAARFGGEEFAIVLPETDSEQASNVAERLRRQIEETPFTFAEGAPPVRATLSLGIASYPTHGSKATEIIDQADLAVYYAKLQGRNRVWVCSPESMALRPTIDGRSGVGEHPEAEPMGAPFAPALAAAAVTAAGEGAHEPVAAGDRGVAEPPSVRPDYEAVVKELSAVMDRRESDTRGHAQRVAAYSVLIARALGLGVEATRDLVNGALLHDVGKIRVPDSVLRKPGPLAVPEWAVMRMHAEQGYQMVQHLGFLGEALDVIRHHHERYDGKGYPSTLKGTDIPLVARIFAVADAFEAITSCHAYRPAYPIDVAREEISRCAGSQFDPRVVEAFLRVDVRELTRICALPADREVLGEMEGDGGLQPEENARIASVG